MTVAGASGWRGEKRGPRARHPQSRLDHRVDHAGDDHAGRRQHDRQRGAAAYPRQPVGGTGSGRVGPDLLHRRGGDHDAADRLARRPARHQIRLPVLGRGLHARLGLVRQRHQPLATRRLPPAARRLRRGPRAIIAISPVADQPARAPRPGDRGLGHRRHARADLRAAARRLADRGFQLALDLLHQPAGRDPVLARHYVLHPRHPPHPSRGLRLLRFREPQHRRRRLAADARPRPTQGLVQLDRDLDLGGGVGGSLLPLHRPHDHRGGPLLPEPRPAQKPQFRGRHGPDVLCRRHPQRHAGIGADDAAVADELSGLHHRACHRTPRHRHDGRDVHRRPDHQPGRQPPDHPGGIAADRGLAVADDRSFRSTWAWRR